MQMLAILCVLVITAGAQPHGGDHSGGQNHDEAVRVTVDLQQSKTSVSSHFVGVTLDSSLARPNWGNLDFSSKKVQNMARALSPCYFRFGGTQADSTTYDLSDASHHRRQVTKRATENRVITADLWKTLNEFIQKVGWDFIMDLNALQRHHDGSWNPDNARQLLQFSAGKNYSIPGFELGNEYDLYHKHNASLTPQQLVKDIGTLRKLLNGFPKYQNSFIIGPETATLISQYFHGFFAAGGAKLVRAATVHHYYFNGRTGHLSDFTSISRLDSLRGHVNQAFSQVHSVDPHLPLWVSETSSAYGGGVHGISDRFVAGFLWLDKLGVLAGKGVETVLRQSFYSTYYGLLDPKLNPNPDFWLTVLYKRIVRGPVFLATGRHDVRVYAACANTDNFKAGSVVVYMLNPNNYTVTFDLHQFHTQPRDRYSLTAGDQDGLLSKYIALNGVKLELVHDALPHLNPVKASPGLEKMAAYSYTFLVFPDARASLCMQA